jgi:dephospho-CoA kinase
LKVIAFTGMPFSGKSEAVSIAHELNIPIVRMGDLVWEQVKRKGLEVNDKNVGKIANNMRLKKGKDIWARLTAERIKELNISESVVIDGIRNMEEVIFFKKIFGEDFHLIAIKVSEGVRYKRALNRKRVDDSTDISEIRGRDKREISWGIKEVINKADITFYNEDSLESFQNRIKKLIKTL